MPRRPTQHDLQTASVREFERRLPSDWESYPHGADVEYGIDRDIEVFSDGHATGLLFHTQVKATETLNGNPPGTRVRRTTWNYWRSLDLPVLIVLWERSTGRMWWKWAHEHDTYGTDTTTETLTIRFDRPWTDDTPTAVLTTVRAWRDWRLAADFLPIPITISAQGTIGTVPATKVAAHLRRLVLAHRHILDLRPAQPDEIRFDVAIRTDESVVQPLGSATATIHHATPVVPDGDEAIDDFSRTLASDLLTVLGMSLARFGVREAAAQLVASAVDTTNLARDPVTAGELVSLLFVGGRTDDAISLLGRLLNSGQELGASATLAAMWAADRISDEDRTKVADMFAFWGDTHAAANDPDGLAGVFSYNAARFLRTTDMERTLTLYDTAAERQPAYKQRTYWQRERAGYAFLAGRASEAISGYDEAIRLGDITCRPLLADAHMLAGNYREALRVFTDITATDDDLPEWTLKRRVLRFLTGTYGVHQQNRNPDAANATADSTDGSNVLIRTLKDDDLLCGHALWKLAHQAAESHRPAFDLFLAAAVSEPSEPSSWLNAMLRIDEAPELAEAVIVTARRMAGHDIVDLILTSDSPDAAEQAHAVEELFSALPPDPPETVEVRSVGQHPDEIAILDVTEAFGRRPG